MRNWVDFKPTGSRLQKLLIAMICQVITTSRSCSVTDRKFRRRFAANQPFK
jgi:hypothetical protein